MKRKLVVGNWKMNGLRDDSSALARKLVNLSWSDRSLEEYDLLICPPTHLLFTIGLMTQSSKIALGGQDCHSKKAGAHTGDTSAEMLKDAGCDYVIVGHSERRINHGEDNALIRDKAVAAQEAGLIPIVCVGENAEERKSGRTLTVIGEQLKHSLPPSPGFVIAYEPVWAIGTGRGATSKEVAEVHNYIRAVLSGRYGEVEADTIRILYGGSVNPKNAKKFLTIAGVDGVLVGGSSLDAEDFWSIGASCLKNKKKKRIKK